MTTKPVIKTFVWRFVPKAIKEEFLASKHITLKQCQKAKWQRVTNPNGTVEWRMDEGVYAEGFAIPRKS